MPVCKDSCWEVSHLPSSHLGTLPCKPYVNPKLYTVNMSLSLKLLGALGAERTVEH